MPEAARELRCSKAHLYNAIGGRLGPPPLPVFHIGRRAFIRRMQLESWIEALEARESESRYASGFFGLKNNELEFIAGA
jgi:hypothetical protein